MDIGLFYSGTALRIDMSMQGALLLTDDTLFTAVLVSLFTDKLAGKDDELPDTDTWRRGWWGDSMAAMPGDQIGSHLWLLFRCKQTEETRLRGEQYTQAALAWMVEDKVAKDVLVQAVWLAQGVLGLAVALVKPDGSAERYYFGLDTIHMEGLRYAV